MRTNNYGMRGPISASIVLLLPLLYFLSIADKYGMGGLAIWAVFAGLPFILYMANYLIISKRIEQYYGLIAPLIITLLVIVTVGAALAFYKELMLLRNPGLGETYTYEAVLIVLSMASGAVSSLEAIKLVCKNSNLICPQQDTNQQNLTSHEEEKNT